MTTEAANVKHEDFSIYSVGPESLSDYDIDDIRHAVQALGTTLKWVVYWYSYGSYEGDGLAVVALRNGRFGVESLGHCSCYGPTDRLSECDWIGRDALIKLLDVDEAGRPRGQGDFDSEEWAAIGPKVRELLVHED